MTGEVQRMWSEGSVDRAVTSDGAVVVTDSPDGRIAQTILAGGHSVIADEPAAVGDDLGPTPYDLLLGALGSCTAMTLRLYATRKGWPLERVSVELTHHRVHAADSFDSEAGHPMIERIDTVLDLGGHLTKEQRNRLVEIAQRCPVHRTLLHEIQIVTGLAERT
jgi:putative redox protein